MDPKNPGFCTGSLWNDAPTDSGLFVNGVPTQMVSESSTCRVWLNCVCIPCYCVLGYAPKATKKLLKRVRDVSMAWFLPNRLKFYTQSNRMMSHSLDITGSCILIGWGHQPIALCDDVLLTWPTCRSRIVNMKHVAFWQNDTQKVTFFTWKATSFWCNFHIWAASCWQTWINVTLSGTFCLPMPLGFLISAETEGKRKKRGEKLPGSEREFLPINHMFSEEKNFDKKGKVTFFLSPKHPKHFRAISFCIWHSFQ